MLTIYIESNTRLSPIQSCSSISPIVVFTWKLGNSSPNFRAILVLLAADLEHNLEVAEKSLGNLTQRCCLLCLVDRTACTCQSTSDYGAYHLDNHEEIPKDEEYRYYRVECLRSKSVHLTYRMPLSDIYKMMKEKSIDNKWWSAMKVT